MSYIANGIAVKTPLANYSLKSCNTLGLQASAAAYLSVSDERELEDALSWAAQHDLPVVPLGEGSNIVLVSDLNALVVRQDSRGITILRKDGDSVQLRVAAGERWHQLVSWTLNQGYYGLENLALIPGTAGAAPIQNIGAYGVELQSFLLRVHARRIHDGEPVVLGHADCQFAYRDSVFKRALSNQLVITAIDLELGLAPEVNTSYPALQAHLAGHDGTPTPIDVFNAVVSILQARLPDPVREPNAGSFFKNPQVQAQQAGELLERFPDLPEYPQPDGRVKLPAAWLIERCGWKGRQKNGLGVHPHHALVLVNYGSDSGSELIALADEITTSVQRTFGVDLEIEPRVYGRHG